MIIIIILFLLSFCYYSCYYYQYNNFYCYYYYSFSIHIINNFSKYSLCENFPTFTAGQTIYCCARKYEQSRRCFSGFYFKIKFLASQYMLIICFLSQCFILFRLWDFGILGRTAKLDKPNYWEPAIRQYQSTLYLFKASTQPFRKMKKFLSIKI